MISYDFDRRRKATDICEGAYPLSGIFNKVYNFSLHTRLLPAGVMSVVR